MKNKSDLIIADRTVWGYGLVLRVLGILCFLMFIIPGRSQDALTDLTHINNTYYGAKTLSMNMSFTVYENGVFDKTLDVEKGSYIKNGKYSYSSYGQLESVVNKDYYIIVDNREKEIMISKIIRGKDSDFGNPSELHEELAEMVKGCKRIKYSALSGNNGKYEIEIENPQYSKLVIEFSRATFFISKILFHYKEKVNLVPEDPGSRKILPVLEVTYSDIKVNPSLAPSLFTYERFLSASKGTFIKKTEYRNYLLTDLYHSSK